MFTAPAMDEFAVDARREVLEEIEAAYALLCGKAEAQPASPRPGPGMRTARRRSHARSWGGPGRPPA